MSLLIKALDKAQAQKAQGKDSAHSNGEKQSDKLTSSTEKSTSATTDKKIMADDLSLSPVNETLTTSKQIQSEVDDTPAALKGSAADLAQREPNRSSSNANPRLSIEPAVKPNRAKAANVFTAKQTEHSSQTAKIAIIIALLAILLLGGFAYWYQFVFNQPAIVIPPRPSMPQAMPDAEIEDAIDATVAESLAELEVVNTEDVNVSELSAPNSGASLANDIAEEKSVFDQSSKQSEVVKKSLTPNEQVITAAEAKEALIDNDATSENTSIEITKAKTESGINEVLMRAYTAYNLGNDEQAQTDYKRVLKQYGANVDAMLGLGAIAARQGRLADADGWYRKVLELEPRNEVAKSGLLSIQQAGRPQAQVSESQIKSLLAASPTDANLHAALGDLYAGQSNWSAAQQAYFEAYRFNPTAENAFNLGVSLDQLGKPTIALPYYKEALQKLDQSSLIDTAALEARISSIQ